MSAARTAERTWWLSDEPIRDRDEAASCVRALLTVLAERAATARIDAHTDYDKYMTPEAQSAEEALEQLGRQQHGRRKRRLNIQLNLDSSAERELHDVYAPWSINVDYFDARGNNVANFHDCGLEVAALLTPEEAAGFVSLVGQQFRLSPIEA